MLHAKYVFVLDKACDVNPRQFQGMERALVDKMPQYSPSILRPESFFLAPCVDQS